jgi:tRNA(adenine34) deaminase
VQQDIMNPSATDLAMMERCVQLSATARKLGELPFACVICDGDRVVAEATNRVRQDGDVTRHAELVAISAAQKALRKKNLSRCTLYSTIEPCPMCSFPIRETRMRRVVYAINSPTMGGVSKWNVLRDTEISNVMPEAFGPVPEVISGLLAREAEMVWWKSHPIIWGIIKQRGCFGPVRAPGGLDLMRAIRPPLGWFRSLLMLHNN